MTTSEAAAPASHLDIATITTVLGGVNTELKCLALAPLDTDSPLTQQALHQNTLSDYGDKLLQRKIPPSELGNVIAGMPEGFVDISTNPGGERTFRLGRIGYSAAALGGHLVTMSRETAVPTRTLVGESFKLQKPDGRECIGTIEARLVVLTGLLTLAEKRWQPTAALAEEFSRFGLTSNSTVSAHLTHLVEVGLVDCRPNPRHAGRYQYRIAGENGHVPPAETIRRYLAIVGRFALLEPEFMDQGRADLEKIRQEKKLIPYLVKRAFASTKHTGKTKRS